MIHFFSKLKELYHKFFKALFSTYTTFAFLFCLIPYRILGMFHADFSVKFLVLFLSFSLFLYVLTKEKESISYLLESIVIQYFFFTMLRFENLIWNMSPFQRYFFLFFFGFSLGAWPSRSDDPTFYYLLFLFLYTFYKRLKDLFLSPIVEPSIYSSILSASGESYSLKWKDIVANISAISLFFFGRSVSNQLGEGASERSFPHMTKRYMFSRAAQAVKSNPELTTVAATLGTVVGYGISEINQNKRHQETMKQVEIANAEAKVANAEAKAANAEAKAANVEAKRANTLKEVELGIKTKEEYQNEKFMPKCCYEESYTSKIFESLNNLFF